MLILKKLERVQNMHLIQENLFEHSRSGTCLEFKLILTRGKDWKIPQCKGGEGEEGQLLYSLSTTQSLNNSLKKF
jgi:hypothetical protein